MSTNTITHIDRIGDLPNGLLSHILSRLPVKDAVQTSILSKDWKFKWTLMYNVDIDTFSVGWKDEGTFVAIAEKVLIQDISLRKCRLVCARLVENELNWIPKLLSVVLRRSAEYLEVEMYNNRQDFCLPPDLLTSTSLTNLHLYFGTRCTIRVQIKICFRKLVKLYLCSVKFSNHISKSEMMIFTFPLLKSLELADCEWVDVKFVEMQAPSLCEIKYITPFEWVNKKDLDISIKIFGKGVNDMTVDGGYPPNIGVIGSTVTSASLRCTYDHLLLSLAECEFQARKLFREHPKLTCLSIYDLRAIGQTGQGVPLPRFTELKKLHLFTPFDAEGFLKLLHAAPNLKFLAILMDCSRYQYDYVEESLPSCVVHHLEEVRFDYTVNGYLPHTYSVEKFLLKNSAQLKTVFIVARDRKFLTKLSTFPQASPHLNIVFRKP